VRHQTEPRPGPAMARTVVPVAAPPGSDLGANRPVARTATPHAT
jgi:hypothetical protein